MANFFKTRGRELTFILLAVVLLLAVVGAVVEGLSFLARSLNAVFGSEAVTPPPTAQFDIEGAKKLGL